jgi:DNA-binding MarR family transcriptional regulator
VREVLEQKYLREVSPFALTLLQFHLLKVIALNGGLQVGEVASVLGVSPPGATKNIDKLERLGLIVRGRCKEDRRATLLSPSARGYRLVQKYEDLKANRLAPVLEEFSEEELSLLARLLERFSLSLAKQEDSDAALCLWCAAYCEADCAVAEIRGGCPYAKVRTGHAGDAREKGIT